MTEDSSREERIAKMIDTFLEFLNYTTVPFGHRFEASSPLSEIIRRKVSSGEVVVIAISAALDCEPEEVDQSKIDPETDTVESLMAKYA